jgi:hypothetical protein
MKLHAVGADQKKRTQRGSLAYAKLGNGPCYFQKVKRIQTIFSTAGQECPRHDRLTHPICIG